jgi:hypothetical protein
VWPTHYAIQLGGPVQISLIPYRIDPTLPLPAGLYSLNIAPLTNCEWTFTVISTNQNAAGIAPVQMQKRTKAGLESSQTASLSDQVRSSTRSSGLSITRKRRCLARCRSSMTEKSCRHFR